MRVEQIFLAEAAVTDSRGALALIGVNQRVLVIPAMPFSIGLRCVVTLTDEVAGTIGREFDRQTNGNISVGVVDPEGRTTFSVTQMVGGPEKRFADLPTILNAISDLSITGTSYGIYGVQINFSAVDGGAQEQTIPIYVIPQPTFTDSDSSTRAFDVGQHA
jgi:hypothetical protein